MSTLMQFDAVDGRGVPIDDIRTAVAHRGIVCDEEENNGAFWLVGNGRQLVLLRPKGATVPNAFVEHAAGAEETDAICEVLTDLGYQYVEE